MILSKLGSLPTLLNGPKFLPNVAAAALFSQRAGGRKSALPRRDPTEEKPGKEHQGEPCTRKDYVYLVAAGVMSTTLAGLAIYVKVAHALSKEEDNNELSKRDRLRAHIEAATKRPSQRVFTRQDVAQHNELEKGVWITYKGNVYDITEFVRHHPGGSHTIMLGAGGDVEPFWNTYTVHHAIEVQKLLANYKIGQLTPEDQIETSKMVLDSNNPYSNDPVRNKLLRVHSQQPFNAETPAKLLMPTYLTPADIFFVRNHLPVPEVDLNDYSLTICFGTDGDPDNQRVLAEFTLDDLKTKFKPHSVDSVIQCTGNRRSDLKRIKEVKGLDWNVGAISNARWTGVRLLDLMDHLGVKPEQLNIKHVQVEGLDCDMTGQSYGASVSADIAFDPNKEVLLAYEMNGQPLTRDHGFPLRFIAPGVTGARNVKWLSKIILSHEESTSHWQRKDYKSFSPNVDMFNLNFDESASIQETPVQSAICDPLDGERVKLIWSGEGANKRAILPAKGYAYSGGGKMVIRVDLSIDGGKNWTTARLIDVPRDPQDHPDYSRRNQHFAWTRWTAEIPLDGEQLTKMREQRQESDITILCRAFDSSYNSQPERAETIWNVRGVVNNSWHNIKVQLDLDR